MYELHTRTIKHALSWERGAFSIKILTSLARSATLGDTSLARLTTELTRCLRIGGGWGTPHKIQRYFQNRGGTLHIPIEVIRSDVQTRVYLSF